MNRNLMKFITGLLLFGSNGIVASGINLPSYDIVVLRTLLGTLLLGALFAIRHRHARPSFSKRGAAFVVLSGVLMGVSWLLLFEAYTLVGVGLSSLLYYCGPVLVMALSPILFAEPLTRTRVAGFATVLAGVVLVNASAFGGELNLLGIAYSVLSAFCLAGIIVFNKKAEGISDLDNAFIQIASAFVTATVGTAALHGLSMDVQPADWPAILVLGLVNTGMGCYFYFSTIGKLKAQTVAVCGYIEPISAVVLSAVLLGETLSIVQIVGAVLVIAGAAGAELFPGMRHRFRKAPLAVERTRA